MALGALLSHPFMDLVLRDIFFAVAFKTENAGLRDKQIWETGAVRVVADLAPARGNGAMDILFI